MDGYDNSFYADYEAYLDERRVQHVHRSAMEALGRSADFARTLDLGCGRHSEFLRLSSRLHHGKWSYLGVDVNAVPPAGGDDDFLVGDYREGKAEYIVGDYREGCGDLPVRLARERGLTGAASLFSTECTAPEPVNRRLYERLLTETSIRRILVSGFYYAHAAGQETVQEVGGLVSWQTVAPLEVCASPAYVERRLLLPCPSNLFGPDVVEVWRLLVRR